MESSAESPRRDNVVPMDRPPGDREDSQNVARLEDATALTAGSELALSEQFVQLAVDTYRWSPGMDWLVNAGDHWQRDLLLTRYTVAKDVCRFVAASLEKEQRRVAVLKAATHHALLNLARTDPQIATPVEAWDADPMLLNTPAGVFDLATGHAVPRGTRLFTQVTGVAPRPQRAPHWAQFLADVFDGDVGMIEFIQRLAGYILTGSTKEQKLFFLYGVGGNGKSVFLEVLEAIVGTYALNLPTEALMARRHEGHPTQYAGLQGKRLAISGEVQDSARWDEVKLKQLTGDATMTARYMRQDFFTFKLTHKHLIAGNFKPRLKGDDAAMARRLVLIPFRQVFTGGRRDNDLPTKLRAEYPGILQWAIDGAVKWVQDGLAIPGAVVNASRDYMTEQNDLEQWLQDCCEITPDAFITTAAAYASFQRWKEANGERAPAKRAFSDRLGRRFSMKRRNSARGFLGFQLRRDMGLAGLEA